MNLTIPTIALAVPTVIQIEEHRRWWAKKARENGWYTQPFFITVWVDTDGAVVDSVADISLNQDLVLDA